MDDDVVDFTPLKNFFCHENQTHYILGLGYSAANDKLKALVEQWVSQGLVKLGRPQAQVSGAGTVE